MGHAITSFFLLPGNLVCNLLGARDDDDRMMIRTMINMLVWNLVVVLLVVCLY